MAKLKINTTDNFINPLKIAGETHLKNNNFDLLRFTFAFIVFLVHTASLSGSETLAVFNLYLSSDIAVKSFFIVSGFLIFMSYENTQNLRHYFVKRLRRIYPAYLFIILLCATLGFIISSLPLSGYISVSLLKYILSNVVFLNFIQPNLPGVFEHNTLQAVNGALWTLKVEVAFYIFVPIAIIAFRQWSRLPVLILLYCCSALYSIAMMALADKTGSGMYVELQRQLPGQLVYFIAGAAGYYYLDYVVHFAKGLITLAIIAFLAQTWLPWHIVQPLALAVLVIAAACIFPSLKNFNKYGDFSYGIYIVHFPILQGLASMGYFKTSPWLTLLIATALVLTSAFILWHLIEKPFLQKSSHYKRR